jgi:hypothetical protein
MDFSWLQAYAYLHPAFQRCLIRASDWTSTCAHQGGRRPWKTD